MYAEQRGANRPFHALPQGITWIKQQRSPTGLLASNNLAIYS